MLVDEVYIKVMAGQGGAGKCGPVKVFKSANTGGDGGRGGAPAPAEVAVGLLRVQQFKGGELDEGLLCVHGARGPDPRGSEDLYEFPREVGGADAHGGG